MFRVSRLLSSAGLTDPWFFTQVARDRGHIVHCIAEQVFTHQPVTVAPAYAGFELALRLAKRTLKFEPICVERRLSRMDLTGRPDAIGWIPDRVGQIHPGPAILDVKSGERYPSHGIQLCWYCELADATADLRAALPEAFRDLPWQRIGVYVKETGRFTLHHYTDPLDTLICSAIIDLARWREAHGLLRSGELAQDDDPIVPVLETENAHIDGPDDHTRPEQPDHPTIPPTGA